MKVDKLLSHAGPGPLASLPIVTDGAIDSIRAAVAALYDGIDDDQRRALSLPFDEEQRRTWMYWPAPRQGLPLASLDSDQRQLVSAVVARLVSLPTFAKITTIMGLEEVLAELEAAGALSRRRQTGLPRDPSLYYTSVFGTPSASDAWGVRFEGHHVSLHVTIVGDAIASTPLFLGANPGEVTHGGRTVVRPLAEEEDLGRALVCALPPDRRARAVIDDRAPDDIITSNAPSVDHDLAGGVALADLTGEAADLARTLVALHVERLPPPLAEKVQRRVDGEFADLHFAWAGDVDRYRPHYYRLSGERFLVEYDNTQNEANHAHSVWRDPRDDFGSDLLRHHHRAQPH
jgi:hypothetical protein